MAFGQLFLTTADAHVCYVTAGVDGHRRESSRKGFETRGVNVITRRSHLEAPCVEL
jgi:hypothetical protein